MVPLVHQQWEYRSITLDDACKCLNVLMISKKKYPVATPHQYENNPPTFYVEIGFALHASRDDLHRQLVGFKTIFDLELVDWTILFEGEFLVFFERFVTQVPFHRELVVVQFACERGFSVLWYCLVLQFGLEGRNQCCKEIYSDH